MNTFKLPATLLHAQANACLAQWLTQLPSDLTTVQVDSASLRQFDSSALAVLLGLRREVTAKGGSLQITGMTDRLRQLASLYGVLELLAPA